MRSLTRFFSKLLGLYQYEVILGLFVLISIYFVFQIQRRVLKKKCLDILASIYSWTTVQERLCWMIHYQYCGLGDKIWCLCSYIGLILVDTSSVRTLGSWHYVLKSCTPKWPINRVKYTSMKWWCEHDAIIEDEA